MEKEKIVKQEKDQKQNQEKDRQVKIMTKRILIKSQLIKTIHSNILYRNKRSGLQKLAKRLDPISLLLLSLGVGLIPLFIYSILPFSQQSNGVSAVLAIIFGVIGMLALCALGIAVLVRHYLQTNQ